MAVKKLLLALLLLGLSGTKIEASSPQKAILGTHTVPKCTSLNSYFVANTDRCVEENLSQTDHAIKAAVKEDKNPEVVTYSYSTESVYYVEPTPALPEPEALGTGGQPITPISQISPMPITQTPQDLFPADGPNLNSDLIFDMINAHRASIGKKPFEKEAGLCTLATIRSVELHDELFVNGNLHSGLYNRNLPYWITEDAKWGSNEAGTLRWWLNSPIHRKAIEGDYTYSCGACNGTQCSQLFTSYTPKQTFTTKTDALTQ